MRYAIVVVVAATVSASNTFVYIKFAVLDALWQLHIFRRVKNKQTSIKTD